MARKISAIVRFLCRRQKIEQDIDREVRFHIERQTEENIRRGMTPREAQRAARMSVGGVEQIKEECREARLGRAAETTLQDVRYGFRVLLKNPAFACTAVITLALGIGVNTAIFSVVYGVLLRPLPYRKGGQIVVLHQLASKAHIPNIPFSAKEIFDYRDNNRTLESVVEHHTMAFLLLGQDRAERVQTAVVSANFFDVLGVTPLLGRTFVASDDTPKADAVLVLSYKYWQARHGGDPHIVGKVFQMNNRPHTVIGVLPPIPQYPTEADVYMPTSACPFRSSPKNIANRQFRLMTAFARLRPGVALEQAQADLSTIASRLEKAYPEAYPKAYGYGISAAPLRDDLTRRARTTFLVLLGGAGFVLLIACANVANLLLARLLKLERELAVRTALGATKIRLMRQLLTESVLLSLAGGALGLALAPPAVKLLTRFAERFTTRAAEVKIDEPVLLFTLLVSIGTGLLFGLAPALSSKEQLSEALKEGSGRTTGSRSRQRLRSGLVVAQVAVSFTLLVGAGLMIRSFVKLTEVDAGFNPDRLLTMRVTPNFSHYKTFNQSVVLSRDILRRVGEVGAVQSVSLASNFPFNPSGVASGPGTTPFEIEGKPQSKGELAPVVDITVVSAGYFETIRQLIVEGRDFNGHDDSKAPKVTIVNQTMAHHRWPGEDAIGKRVKLTGSDEWTKIIGVARDTKEYGLSRPISDEMYLPVEQSGFPGSLLVRTSIDPQALTPLVRKALHDVDSQLAIDKVATIDTLEQEWIASPRVITILLGLFAALALAISATGIAAVMALSVSQRTRELGVRMALGASQRTVVRMIVRNGLKLALAGTVVGVAGALTLTPLLSSLLYGTGPKDAITFIGVLLLFLAVSMVACFVPARQVTSIDPVIALRQE
jgi:putative ABC transport system permease protein